MSELGHVVAGHLFGAQFLRPLHQHRQLGDVGGERSDHPLADVQARALNAFNLDAATAQQQADLIGERLGVIIKKGGTGAICARRCCAPSKFKYA